MKSRDLLRALAIEDVKKNTFCWGYYTK